MMKFALRSHQLFRLVEVKASWFNDGAMVWMEYIRTHVMLPPGAKTSFKAYLEDQAVDLYFFGGFKYDVVITVPSTLRL